MLYSGLVTTQTCTLSLHDALPILATGVQGHASLSVNNVGTARADAEPRVHSRTRRRSHVQVTYAGTPVATIPRPISPCTGRATMVLMTIPAAAAMNSAGVTG